MSPRKTVSTDRRAQGYILEALLAILLISSVIFFSATSLQQSEPLLSEEDREVQNEIESDITSVVDKSIEDGTIKASILNWNNNINRYNDTNTLQSEDGYYRDLPTDNFGDRLFAVKERHTQTEGDDPRNIGIIVEVIPHQNTSSGSGQTLDNKKEDGYNFISTGSAGQTLVVTERQISLHGKDQLRSEHEEFQTDIPRVYESHGHERLCDLNSNSEFPIPSAESSPDCSSIYNVVTIRVIVWF